MQAHHCVARAQGGDDLTANLVWLSSGVHHWFHHGAPWQRHDAGHMIRKGLTEENIAYIVAHERGGWEWLDRKYPAESW